MIKWNNICVGKKTFHIIHFNSTTNIFSLKIILNSDSDNPLAMPPPQAFGIYNFDNHIFYIFLYIFINMLTRQDKEGKYVKLPAVFQTSIDLLARVPWATVVNQLWIRLCAQNVSREVWSKAFLKFRHIMAKALSSLV